MAQLESCDPDGELKISGGRAGGWRGRKRRTAAGMEASVSAKALDGPGRGSSQQKITRHVRHVGWETNTKQIFLAS